MKTLHSRASIERFPSTFSGLPALLLMFGAACNSGDPVADFDPPRTARAALAPSNDAIMGFEAQGVWSTTTAGATLAQSATHSQGSSSLSVRPSNSNGYTPIVSVPLSTLADVSSTLALDVMLPTAQPNPQWLGTMQAYLNCPSRGIYSQFLAQVELTGKPLNVWNTISFPLNNLEIAGLLRSGYSDLTITIALNVQVPTTGTYFIDNLRFVPVPANGCGGLPSGTLCTDANACTQRDTCQSGVCRGGTPVTCAASDQCHLAGTCNPSTGVCSNPQKPNGMACSDGNACTRTDFCQSGTCVGTNPVTCQELDACHVAGACDPGTGICSNPARSDGTPCQDGNACTQVDTCIAGVCTGGNPVECTAMDQCHEAGSCDPATGECSNPPSGDGKVCDDGNACSQTDECISGVCTGGNPVGCAAMDQCHEAGSCDPATGECSNPPSDDGKPCNDGNLCTQNDACIAGLCSTGPGVPCGAGDACHGPGVCDPATGACSNPKLADGTRCSTNQACLTGESCADGVCTHGINQPCGSLCGDLGQCDDKGTCKSIALPTVCGDDAHPNPNEVIVWEEPNFKGTCTTLRPGQYPTAASLAPVHNDSISSVRVGCGVRAMLFHDEATTELPLVFRYPGDPPNPFLSASPGLKPPPESITPGRYWYLSHRATFEAGSSHDLWADAEIFRLGRNVENDISAAVVKTVDHQRRVAYAFMGDYPLDSGDPIFQEQPQGIAHAGDDWIVTNTWAMFRIPFVNDFNSMYACTQLTCLANRSKGSGNPWVNIPDWLEGYCQQPSSVPAGMPSCDHMGDPDQAGGYIFLPMEGCENGKARIGVYRGADFTLLGSYLLPDGTSGWVAVDPLPGGKLWTSDSSRTIRRYTIRWDKLENDQPPINDFLEPVDPASECQDVTKPRNCWNHVSDVEQWPVGVFVGGQGGVFDAKGKVLYLSNSDSAWYHGIVAVNPDTGELLTKTGDNYGPFNFQREYTNQEEEGLDYFDQWEYAQHNNPPMPGGGELHALLNFDDWSNVSIKHYTAWPERYCKAEPGDDEITLWSEAQFKGVCRTLQVGDFPSYSWMYPMPTDWPSSIKVGKNVQATLFEHDDFWGGQLPVFGDRVNKCGTITEPKQGQLSDFAAGNCGWSEKVSSLKVTKL